MKRCLIVVDYQNDFVSGALGFPGAVALEQAIAEKIRQYREPMRRITWIPRRAATCPWPIAFGARPATHCMAKWRR